MQDSSHRTCCICINEIWVIEGLGATLNVAKPTKGSTVAIFGLGAVGLAVSFFPLFLLSHTILMTSKLFFGCLKSTLAASVQKLAFKLQFLTIEVT